MGNSNFKEPNRLPLSNVLALLPLPQPACVSTTLLRKLTQKTTIAAADSAPTFKIANVCANVLRIEGS